MMKELQNRLKDQHIEVIITDEAREYIAVNGFDPIYGAKPMKRFIQRSIETKLAREIISGNVLDHSTVYIIDGELTVRVK